MHVDLVYRVLDEQIVDVDGRRCGRVDDLEFEGRIGEPLRVHAILSGSGTWHRRLPRRLRGLAAKVFGTGVSGRDLIRVPWSDVDDISSVVKLRRKAREVGLGQGDARDSGFVAKLPGS